MYSGFFQACIALHCREYTWVPVVVEEVAVLKCRVVTALKGWVRVEVEVVAVHDTAKGKHLNEASATRLQMSQADMVLLRSCSLPCNENDGFMPSATLLHVLNNTWAAPFIVD